MYNTVTYLEKVGMAHLGFGFWDNHIIMPGAPQTIISQLNFNNVADTIGRVKFLCDEYPTTKVKVKSFMKLMNDYFWEEVTKDQETQTVSQVADATTQTEWKIILDQFRLYFDMLSNKKSIKGERGVSKFLID